ncbi:TetR/AcrR family transcriptional regulator [Neobacillus mesonae]|nr:TetR/AcrR family transcriptional regulator [Neobacillus mesonae]
MSVQHPDKRVRRSKENFKSTLLTLMEQKSFHDITITEIVHAADYNRGTFYAHYESKEALLDEMIEDIFEEMTEAHRKPYIGLNTIDFNLLPPESIILFHHFLEHKRFYKIMFDEKTNYNFYEKMSKRLDRLFREEFEFSYIDVDPHIDINLFSTYRIHGIIGLIMEWIDNNFDQSPEYMGEQLIHILKFKTPVVFVKNDKLKNSPLS